MVGDLAFCAEMASILNFLLGRSRSICAIFEGTQKWYMESYEFLSVTARSHYLQIWSRMHWMIHLFTLHAMDFWALLRLSSLSCRFLDGAGIGALLCLAE